MNKINCNGFRTRLYQIHNIRKVTVNIIIMSARHMLSSFEMYKPLSTTYKKQILLIMLFLQPKKNNIKYVSYKMTKKNY